MNVRAVRSAMRRWSGSVDRPLPWRGERDPYRVLVSEVMLQQTQAARVVAVYPRFVRLFPTLASLASAPASEVLKAWGSLGYNRRALNLWRTARACPDGLPRDVEGLMALPGIGPYTARAVASFAYGADAAAVDANVRRILTRMSGAEVDVQGLADRLVPAGGSRWWNQAMMDLGATVCMPRKPRCERCPLSPGCAWTPAPDAVRRASAVPFTSTSRYARGRVVQALRRTNPATLEHLVGATGLDRRRLGAAVASLERDQLVSRSRFTVWLGPSERDA